ncbi:MAG: cytochrome b N-terminal domain-containing protein [Planctomycetota bacterium]
MNKVLCWIDDRSGAVSCVRNAGQRVVAGVSWRKVWPAAFLFSAFVQAVTGLFLWIYYSPSAQTAWESVYYVQHEVAGGWLLRAMHHYAAHVTIAMGILCVLEMVIRATYRAPREVVFWLVIGVSVFALAAIITGDLLYWDRNGFSSTKVRVGFLNLLPVIGNDLYTLAVGGAEFGSLTLTRFFALHAGVFGALAVGLTVLLVLAARRAEQIEVAAAPEKAAPAWPQQTFRNVVACLVVLVAILALSLQHGTGPHGGVKLGSPADVDPANTYAAARPEWMLTGVYEFAHFFPGALNILPIFVFPGLVMLVFLLMPFVGRSAAGQVFNVVFTLGILAGIVGMTIYSWQKDAAAADHQWAILEEREASKRAVVLARNMGIPPSGARTLLQQDPKHQGSVLYHENCLSCHSLADAKGDGLKANPPSAPNLYGYATPEWIAGFLDPERIVSEDYFGGTALKNGEMVGFIKDIYDGLEPDEIKDIKADMLTIATLLSDEAKLPGATPLTKEAREEALDVMDTNGCFDCHVFHGKGTANGPSLTGYGSLQWTEAIVANPADERFYGDRNDRMPIYQDVLTPEQITLVSKFLRREWFEPDTGDAPAAEPQDANPAEKPPVPGG